MTPSGSQDPVLVMTLSGSLDSVLVMTLSGSLDSVLVMTLSRSLNSVLVMTLSGSLNTALQPADCSLLWTVWSEALRAACHVWTFKIADRTRFLKWRRRMKRGFAGVVALGPPPPPTQCLKRSQSLEISLRACRWCFKRRGSAVPPRFSFVLGSAIMRFPDPFGREASSLHAELYRYILLSWGFIASVSGFSYYFSTDFAKT